MVHEKEKRLKETELILEEEREAAGAVATAGASSRDLRENKRLTSENNRLLEETEEMQGRIDVLSDENEVTLEKVRTLRSRVQELELATKRTLLEREELYDQMSTLTRTKEEEETQ